MSMIYLPSCKFTSYSPEGSKQIKSYLSENYDIKITGCCRPNHKNFTPDDTIVYICNTCAAFTEEDSEAKELISIWEILDKDENFEFPNYNNKKMAIQDCWRVYDNKNQQMAIRSILRKMNIDVEELEDNFEKTRFCGTTLYEDLPKQSAEFAPRRFTQNTDGLFNKYTEEEQVQFMKNHSSKIAADDVISYCIGCMKGHKLCEKNSHHLLDLIFEIK